MDVQVKNFSELVRREWGYPKLCEEKLQTQLHLRTPNIDVTGGTIRREDIDLLAQYPEVRSVSVSGLRQDTFVYFVQRYGRQLRYIDFFKNKLVEDWSLLGTLPELEGMHFFHNQRITSLWDMRGNTALKALVIEDFTRLHDLSGLETAPALEWFSIGDAAWSTTVIDSLSCCRGTGIRRLGFSGKAIRDMDLSFLREMPALEMFDFAPNLLTTEQVAWIVGNCPHLKGRSLASAIKITWHGKTDEGYDVPAVMVVGKRKPTLPVEGNEQRIQRYLQRFEAAVEQYRGQPFPI